MDHNGLKTLCIIYSKPSLILLLKQDSYSVPRSGVGSACLFWDIS